MKHSFRCRAERPDVDCNTDDYPCDCQCHNRCEICGEQFRPDDHPQAYQGSDERGEFVIHFEPIKDGPMTYQGVGPEFRLDCGIVPVEGQHILAHAQCGLNYDLAMA